MEVRLDLHNVHTVTAKGRVYYYHRPTRTRLPDDPTSVEFIQKLAELNKPKAMGPPVLVGTLSHLIRSFKAHRDFTGLAKATRSSYERYLVWLDDNFGADQAAALTREDVLEIRDGFQDTPRKANYVVAVISLLYTWGLDRPAKMGLPSDFVHPATKIKKFEQGDGYEPWTPEQQATFLAGAQPRFQIAYALGRYLGLRESDVVALPRTAYRDGAIKVTPSKTRKKPLVLPVHATLKDALEEVLAPAEDTVKLRGVVPTTLVSNRSRRPFTIDGFKTSWGKEIERLGLKGCTFHGLRVTLATEMADGGATEQELMDFFGWTSATMARRYTRRANQAGNAAASMRKLEQKQAETVKLQAVGAVKRDPDGA